jgi:ribosomal protein L37E
MNRCICCGAPTNNQKEAYCNNCIVGTPKAKYYYWEDDSQFDDSDHLDSTFKNGEKNDS